jgi:hypothetical protein
MDVANSTPDIATDFDNSYNHPSQGGQRWLPEVLCLLYTRLYDPNLIWLRFDNFPKVVKSNRRRSPICISSFSCRRGLCVNIAFSPIGTIFSARRASQPVTKWRVTTGKRPGIACALQGALNRDSLFGYFLGAKK